MRKVTSVRMGVMALLSLGLFACTAVGVGGPTAFSLPYPPPGYAHHVHSQPLDLYWNCARPGPNVLQMDGVAVNQLGSGDVRFLKFELTGVNAQGFDVSSAKFDSPNLSISTGESQPFRIDLPTTGAETRFDLYYQFGYHHGSESHFMESFYHRGRGVLLAAAGDFPLLLVGNTENVVRDACSPTAHLARWAGAKVFAVERTRWPW